MICPACEVRFASFPKEDYEFIDGLGICEKKEGAKERRTKVFESNKNSLCSEECDEATNSFLVE